MRILLRLGLDAVKSLLRMVLGLILSIALAASFLYFIFAVQSPGSPASRWFWPKARIILQQPAVQKVTTEIAKVFGQFAAAGPANERQTESSGKATGQKPVGSKAKATSGTKVVSITKAASAQSVSDESIESVDEMAQEMFKLVNQARTEAGEEPLRWDSFLARVARIRAEDMVNRRYFSHNTEVNGELKPLVDIEARKLDPQFTRTLGENIGEQTAGGAKEAHVAVMHSPGHRKNLLDSRWKYIGIAFVKGSPDYSSISPQSITCVQVFSN